MNKVGMLRLVGVLLMALGPLGCGVAAEDDVEDSDSAVKVGSSFITPLADGVYDAEDKTLSLKSSLGSQEVDFSTSVGVETLDVAIVGRKATVTTYEGDELELVPRGDAIEVKGTGPAVGTYRKRRADALLGKYAAEGVADRAGVVSLTLAEVSGAAADEKMTLTIERREGDALRGEARRSDLVPRLYDLEIDGCPSRLSASPSPHGLVVLVYAAKEGAPACAFFGRKSWGFGKPNH